ncbi:hypothetical protein LTR36_008540 [Oleoguttula mirabilis]|uniref:HD/PDEase domain-containing protein n=1 Tax=Oleoguttula mirabilis TaxID=1507867 RepID=A0AAV9JUT0_9PEZI|nr:hypothetical protein LTR36_008540 [Oleoguttula mirabilis]
MCPRSSGPATISTSSPNSATSEITTPDCVPTDTISRVAYSYASTALHPAILHHSLRVFLYARTLAQREHPIWSSPDRLALLFAACIYHDIGTVCGADSPQRFEVEGADLAAQNLRSANVPEHDVHEVWVAIAVHTSPHIAERISPLARLVRLAVLVDFKVAVQVKDFPTEAEVEVNEALFPRLDAAKVLGDAVVAQTVRRPEKAPSASWPSVLLRSRVENPGWEGVNKAF